MRTLFLNPPSFECFAGGASSRWPAPREIESFDFLVRREFDHQIVDYAKGKRKVIYPELEEAALVDWVERFYGEYYFRPRVIWRVVRHAVFDFEERKRLSKQAREYLTLRAKRKQFVAQHRQATVLANGKR
jgi:hypothetical protein